MLLVGFFGSRPIPHVRSIYCAVGRDTASTAMALVCGTSMFLKKESHSLNVTSCSPIQNAETSTFTWGPSSASLPFSDSGLPMINEPAGNGTILNFADDPEILCSYGL